jgi:hypothetical protein
MKDERKYLIKGQDENAKKLNYIKNSLMIKNGRAICFTSLVEIERCEGYAMESFVMDFTHKTTPLHEFKRATKKQIEIAQTLFAEKSHELALQYAEIKGVEI